MSDLPAELRRIAETEDCDIPLLKAADRIERLTATLLSVRTYLVDIGDYPEPGEIIKTIDMALSNEQKVGDAK